MEDVNKMFPHIRRLVEYIRVMKDNSIIIVLKGGIQIREPIETNNSIYRNEKHKSCRVVGLLTSLSEKHRLLLTNLLQLIKMQCSYFVQQRHLRWPKLLIRSKKSQKRLFLTLFVCFLPIFEGNFMVNIG